MSSRTHNHVTLLLIYNLRHYVKEMTETGAEKLDEQTVVISIYRLITRPISADNIHQTLSGAENMSVIL